MTALVSVSGMSRRFGSVRALRGVDLELEPGEIHALVGENGAGKSTLINILAGRRQPDEGHIRVDGTTQTFSGRSDSVRAGIGVVFQHFSLVGRFSVAENLQVGRPGGGRLIRVREARRLIDEWAQRVGAVLDADATVDDLSVAQRQLAEFIIALSWGCRVLLLDEPTSVLSPQDGDRLLDLVKGCADSGVAVLLVTHKLREVQALADRVTVLRSGEVTGRHLRGAIPPNGVLVKEMMGEETFAPSQRSQPTDQVRLEVKGLFAGRLHGVDLSVNAGEVVGVAGVAGSGQLDLVKAVAGLAVPRAGQVLVNRMDVTGRPGRARKAGVAYVPEDRSAEGLATGLSVAANAVAKDLWAVGSWRGIDRHSVDAQARKVIGYLGVRPAVTTTPVGKLSGGNQQRLLVGRELLRNPSVVVAAEPTRGLDTQAGSAVAGALRSVAAQGAAVMVASTDVDELVDLADRVLVISGGVITLDASASEVCRDQIGHAMAGVP